MLHRLLLSLLLSSISLVIPISSSAIQIPDEMPSQAEYNHEYEELYGKGLEAVKEGNFKAAEQYFNQSLNNYEGYIPAKLGLVHVYFNTQSIEKGERLLLDLHRQHPDDEYVQSTYGKYAATKGNYTEAIKAFKQAIKINEKRISNYLNLADLYMNSGVGNLDEAISLYRKATELDQNHPGANYALGVALVRTGKTSDSLAYFKRSAENAPNNPMPLIILGRSYLSLGDYAAARESYLKALERDPKQIAAMLGVADVDSAQNNTEAAISAYQTIAKQFNQDDRPFMRLGMEYQRLQMWENANDAFKKVIELNPASSLAYNNLAWLASEYLDNSSDAVKWAKQAIVLSPQTATFHDTLGWAYRADNQLEQAKDALLEAVRLNPKFQLAYYHLGVVYSDLNEKSNALDAFEKAIEINKDFEVSAQAKEKIESLK